MGCGVELHTTLSPPNDFCIKMGRNESHFNIQNHSLKPFHETFRTVSLPDSIILGSHSNISFSDSARNLGVILDSNLSMKKHVIKICQIAYFELNALVPSAGFSLKMQPRLLLLPISSHGLTTATVSSWVLLILSSNLSRKFTCKTRSLGTPRQHLSWNNCTGFPIQNVLNIKSLVCV